MRWIAHILTVFAVIGCLVGAGQARADYVTHTECKNSQSVSSSADVSAALAPIVTVAEQSPIQQLPEQGTQSELSKVKHCAYCWANLPVPLGSMPTPQSNSLLDLSDRHRDGSAVFGLDRPPKDLHI